MINRENYNFEDIENEVLSEFDLDEFEEIDENEFEEFDEYEEFEDLDEFDESVYNLNVECSIEESIEFITNKISEFRKSGEENENRDEKILINPRVFSHLIEIEGNINTKVDGIRLFNQINDLVSLGKTELTEYKKEINKQKREQEILRRRTEEEDSAWRFYERGVNNRLEFREGLVGDEILEEEKFLYDGGDVLIYKDGYYQQGGIKRLDYLIKEKLGATEYKKNRHDSVKSYVISEIVEMYNFDEKSETTEHLEKMNDYICFKNGILEWKTGKLFNHSPNFYFKNQIPLNYNPKASTKFAMNFLKSVLPHDSIDTILEYIGYSLTPNMAFEKSLMLTGGGSNGKSMFLLFVKNLLGKKNVSSVSLKNIDGHKFMLALMNNKLANISADISAKMLEDVENFKMLSTGDALMVENKGQTPFEMKPYAKQYFSANDIPPTMDQSDGFFRRWLICPFLNKFNAKNSDRNLKVKVSKIENLEGFLLLAIEGLKRLSKNGGFSESKTMDNMMKVYIEDNKPIKRFVEEECMRFEKYDSDCYIIVDDLFSAYEDWCDRMNMKAKNRNNFFKDFYRDFPMYDEREKEDNTKRIRVKQKRIDGGKPKSVIFGITLGEYSPKDIEENEVSKVANIFKN